jgi:hypothetical protein
LQTVLWLLCYKFLQYTKGNIAVSNVVLECRLVSSDAKAFFVAHVDIIDAATEIVWEGVKQEELCNTKELFDT